MLRTVKSFYPSIRLIPGRVSYSGGLPSITSYGAQFKRVSSESTVGSPNIELIRTAPGGVLFAVGMSESNDHFVGAGVLTSKSSFRLANYNSSGANTQGNFHFLVGVADSRDPRPSDFADFSVDCGISSSRLIVLDITGGATPTFKTGSPPGREATIARNGAGDYTITFRHAFGELPICVGIGIGAQSRVTLVSRGMNSIRVRRTAAGAAADGDMTLLVVGSQQRFSSSVVRAAKTNWRSNVLMPFETSATALTLGAGPLSTGTISGGSIAPNITRALPRAPVIFANTREPSAATYASVISKGTNTFTIRTYNTSHVQTAPTELTGFVFGQTVAANESSF